MRAYSLVVGALLSFLVASAHAQNAPVAPAAGDALENAVANLPLERVIGSMLSSIDVDALALSLEQTAKAAADGKTPNAASQQPLQDLQAKMQQKAAAAAPELLRGMASLVGPMLAEMKRELSAELTANQ
jgi:hypothetical protein